MGWTNTATTRNDIFSRVQRNYTYKSVIFSGPWPVFRGRGITHMTEGDQSPQNRRHHNIICFDIGTQESHQEGKTIPGHRIMTEPSYGIALVNAYERILPNIPVQSWGLVYSPPQTHHRSALHPYPDPYSGRFCPHAIRYSWVKCVVIWDQSPNLLWRVLIYRKFNHLSGHLIYWLDDHQHLIVCYRAVLVYIV